MRELQELKEAQDCKNSEIFQKYFVSPVYKELENLKSAYSCETLRELSRIKGKKEGLEFFLKLLKKVDENHKLKSIDNSSGN